MKLRAFVKANRKRIDTRIAKKVGVENIDDIPHRSDRERELWVCNDWYLYRYAKSKGVRM